MTTSNPTLGLSLPQIFLDGHVDAALVGDVARRAEAAGFETLWVQEQLLGRVAVLDALSLLDFVSGLTSRIRLGLGVVVLSRHHPIELAKRVSSLDALSGGRVEFGVGIGGAPPPELGVPGDRRVRRFNEALDVIEALWTGEPANYDGEIYQLAGASMAPVPLQRPRPPLWIGATAPAAIRRAIRRADGWMGAGSTSIAEFRDNVQLFNEELERLGRKRSEIRVSKRVYLSVDREESRARERARDWFRAYYNNPEMGDRVAVSGTWEQCAAQIQELAETGLDHILLNPLFDPREHLDLFERHLGGWLTASR